LDEVEEENKAEPPVVIDRRGAARSGGAMAGRRCTVGFLPCVASTWRRRKRKGKVVTLRRGGWRDPGEIKVERGHVK
jgi:hypothetical protein